MTVGWLQKGRLKKKQTFFMKGEEMVHPFGILPAPSELPPAPAGEPPRLGDFSFVGLGCRVLGFRVQDLGFRIQGFRA